jgi:hypothetical protein
MLGRDDAVAGRGGLGVRAVRGTVFALNGMYPGPQAPLPRQYWKRRTPGDNPPFGTPGGRLTVVLLIVAVAVVLSLLVALLAGFLFQGP